MIILTLVVIATIRRMVLVVIEIIETVTIVLQSLGSFGFRISGSDFL